MKNVFKLSGLTIMGVLLATTAMAATDGRGAIGGKIGLFKDCQLLKEVTMNNTPLKAYQNLKQLEAAMFELEKPIKEIEGEMAEFTSKIEALTALAIQETATSLHIDKGYLRQQEDVAGQFDDFMSQHQHVFDALGAQRRKISAAAKIFAQSIAPLVTSIEHEYIEIMEPGNTKTKQGCQNSMIDM